MKAATPDLKTVDIRDALSNLSPSPKIEPNETVSPDRVFTPDSHRSVLDLGRQLVVGNRGMGKSLWAHALLESEVRERVAETYGQPTLRKTKVIIGFNGSDKKASVAPTRDAIKRALAKDYTEDDIWRSVIYRAMRFGLGTLDDEEFDNTLSKLRASPLLFEEEMSTADNIFVERGENVLVIFDAIDLVAEDWKGIKALTTSLLKRALGLKSFRSFRLKIFIRPDQFADPDIFRFTDGSKLKNEHVDLSWQPHELFGLLFFEIMRQSSYKQALTDLAEGVDAREALSFFAKKNRSASEKQITLVNSIAGTYMGSDARRGKVYTWVPLHLSDAKNACSPRTFLTAWKRAAEHEPAPKDRVVDHLGLIEGVRKASNARLEELREDYRWIDGALGALKGNFVPIERAKLMAIWDSSNVVQDILRESKVGDWLAPVELERGTGPSGLLDALKSIAVMEERANGKINVPDIFRVEAGIKRKGGVAVPRRR